MIGKKALVKTSITIFTLIVVCSYPLYASKVQVLSRTKGGLFSTFFSVLAHLTWCEKNNLTPYVYWGKDSNYYEKDSEQKTENVWEYYFEQLSNTSYTPDQPNNGIETRNTYASPDNFYIPFSNEYEKVLESSFRINMKKTIERYIKIKPHIVEKMESFYHQKLAGKNTIGIHIRGTDKSREIQSVALENICAKANECAKSFSSCQFFVATDEASLLAKAKTILEGPVVTYDSYRSVDGRAIHKKQRPYHSKYMLGEEVLIEVLLLTRCNQFVHTRSNVSTAVLFFNPDLQNFVLI